MVSQSFLLIIMSVVINLFALSAALFAEELYVRPSADEYGNESGISFLDAFDGWSGIVWGSGVGKVGPGDTVYVCGDFSNEYVNIAESGKPDNRIIIRGDYMGNIATIDAQGKRKAMRLDGADYITIMNLKLTGAAYEGLGSVAPCKNLIVDNVTCYKNKGTGIFVSGNGLILRNLTVYSNLSCGIRITNANSAYVFKCNIFNNGTEGNNDDGLFVGNASEAFIIEECIVSGQKGQSSYDVSDSADIVEHLMALLMDIIAHYLSKEELFMKDVWPQIIILIIRQDYIKGLRLYLVIAPEPKVGIVVGQ